MIVIPVIVGLSVAHYQNRNPEKHSFTWEDMTKLNQCIYNAEAKIYAKEVERIRNMNDSCLVIYLSKYVDPDKINE